MNPCYTNVMYCTHNLAKMVACITFVSVMCLAHTFTRFIHFCRQLELLVQHILEFWR